MQTLTVDALNMETGLGPLELKGGYIEASVDDARKYSAAYFPAYFQKIGKGSVGDEVQQLGEASCYYYPDRKAVAVCSVSGRFLSELCDIEIDGVHYSPDAFNAELRKGTLKHFKNRTPLYDGIALIFAIYPVISLIGLYFSWITGPMALFFAIRAWNQPKVCIVPRGRGRVIAALFLGGLQTLAWILGLLVLVVWLLN